VCAPSALARPTISLNRPLPAPAGAAATQVSKSSNWAGYAVHGHGASFRQVTAFWTEPTPSCRRGHRTFSSYWVGLGGYRTTSKELEQTGTEVDCTSAGRVHAFAWWELVPGSSVKIHLKVPPGDLIEGSVTVVGHRVRVALQDLTRHTVFSKVLHPGAVDVSSAEWIVEAPSRCSSHWHCSALPLTNFGVITFAGALAEPVRGQPGSVSDPRWQRTRISLSQHDQRFVSSHPGLASGGLATPAELESSGSAFAVSYAARDRHTAAARDPDGAPARNRHNAAQIGSRSQPASASEDQPGLLVHRANQRIAP
jgi:hypothetical protein